MWWIPELVAKPSLGLATGYRWAMLALFAMQLVIGYHLAKLFQAGTSPGRMARVPVLCT